MNESQSRVGLKANSKSLHHHNQHASCCYHHGVGNGGAFAKQRGLNPLSANCLNNHHSHHHYYYHHYHHYYGEDDDKLKITDRFHKSSSLFHRVFIRVIIRYKLKIGLKKSMNLMAFLKSSRVKKTLV